MPDEKSWVQIFIVDFFIFYDRPIPYFIFNETFDAPNTKCWQLPKLKSFQLHLIALVPVNQNSYLNAFKVGLNWKVFDCETSVNSDYL